MKKIIIRCLFTVQGLVYSVKLKCPLFFLLMNWSEPVISSISFEHQCYTAFHAGDLCKNVQVLTQAPSGHKWYCCLCSLNFLRGDPFAVKLSLLGWAHFPAKTWYFCTNQSGVAACDGTCILGFSPHHCCFLRGQK